MREELVQKIKSDPKFHELVQKRSAFAWKLAITMLVIYYAFILTIAFSPETLGTPIGDGVMTVGIPVGVAIILISFLLTGIYVKRANGEFDELTNRIKADARIEK